jgi:hypothetical protein
LFIGGSGDGMNNERDIIMNTQPYAEDLGITHTDHVAPGNVLDKVPSKFVCFSEHWRLPRKYCKSEGGSYDVFVWSEGRWQFHDNVGEDTANEWYRNESETYVR